ncbi:hypothetical protein [Aestuariivivens sediminicola]|uniref:hypothetical protein n=1 Tax=Aestuariivivens sediminicola TaxID=2913560 RepID=UPI001F59A145|nr:hypothetical protein [Aestuariivivens sediminicola]
MKAKMLTLLVPFLLLCCKSEKKEQETYASSKTEKKDYIEVVTNLMDFVTVDTIKSGWNTFKYSNKSDEPHFILIDDYPDGKTLDTIKARVMPAFDKGMASIMENDMDAAMAAFGELPSWFPEVKFVGGTGLISPKKETNVTVKLEPGPHIMECYVKMASGVFHVSMGMVKEIYVLEEDSGNKPPEADIQITVSSAEGINYTGDLTKGHHIISVHYVDQSVYEHFIGHDVNLVKLDDSASLDELEAWMNWMDPKGLISPAPSGVTFLGGVNNGLAGSTHYFEVHLDPGNYAFISEVPSASSKGLLKTFMVE